MLQVQTRLAKPLLEAPLSAADLPLRQSRKSAVPLRPLPRPRSVAEQGRHILLEAGPTQSISASLLAHHGAIRGAVEEA